MSDYTPTTDEVRDAAGGSLNYIGMDEFDRWLAAHDAGIRANERAKYTHVCADNNCCFGDPL